MKFLNFIIKSLIYIPIIFFFLPAFVFLMPGINKECLIFYLSIYIAIIIMLIKDGDFLFYKTIQVCKKTPLIYFVIFLLFICVNSLFLSALSITTLSQTIISIIMRLILAVIPTFVYFIWLFLAYIPLKKFIKIFMFLFWLNLICGFVAYAGRWFDISFINGLFDFFANLKLVRASAYGVSNLSAETYFLEKRLTGLYEEPGILGQFLYFFLPFVYTFANTKLRIYKNKLFNITLKKTLIPFTWLNLILTLSPMNLVLGIIITIIYYFRQLKSIIIKYWSILLFSALSIMICFFNINLSETYLSRIINIITNIHSFEDFILIEPSLATRVVGYINGLCIFIQHPLTGVGLGNELNYMYNQYLHSIVPLTPEIIYKTSKLVQQGLPAFLMPGFIYSLLAENGIISVSIFIFFYLKTFQVLYKQESFCDNELLFNSCIIKSIKYSMIALFIDFIYDLNFTSPYLHLILALAISLIYFGKTRNTHNMRGIS